MALKKCCYCIDLRIGCIIFAVLGFIVNSGFFGTVYPHCFMLPGARGCSDAFYVLVAGSTLGVLGSLCLLLGAIISNKIVISLYLVVEGLRMMLYIAYSGLSFKLFSDFSCSTVFKFPASPLKTNCILILVGGIMGLISVLLWIYVWVCALSLVLNIRKKESNNYNKKKKRTHN